MSLWTIGEESGRLGAEPLGGAEPSRAEPGRWGVPQRPAMPGEGRGARRRAAARPCPALPCCAVPCPALPAAGGERAARRRGTGHRRRRARGEEGRGRRVGKRESDNGHLPPSLPPFLPSRQLPGGGRGAAPASPPGGGDGLRGRGGGASRKVGAGGRPCFCPRRSAGPRQGGSAGGSAPPPPAVGKLPAKGASRRSGSSAERGFPGAVGAEGGGRGPRWGRRAGPAGRGPPALRCRSSLSGRHRASPQPEPEPESRVWSVSANKPALSTEKVPQVRLVDAVSPWTSWRFPCAYRQGTSGS